MKYCSRRHSFADWDRLHPRQPRLDFDSYLAPRPLPDSPGARRNVGKAKAASNHRDDLELARRLALEMLGRLGTLGTCIVSDVRSYALRGGHQLPWHLPWVGSLFQYRWFVPTGARRMTTHIQGNARKVNVYALSPEGWATVRGAKNSP